GRGARRAPPGGGVPGRGPPPPRGLGGSTAFARAPPAAPLVPGEGGRPARPPYPDLRPDPDRPADTRLWAALQDASGGPWAGAVYDVDRIVRLLEAGRRALGED